MKKNTIQLFFIILTGLIFSLKVNAQWYRASGIDDRFIYSIRAIDNYVFAATDSGAYRSSDGINWEMIINGFDTNRLNVRDFYKGGDNLYAALMAGLYVSKNYGESWQITNYPQTYPAISVYAIDNIVLASTTGGGLFRSTDNATTWNPIIGDNFWKYVMVDGNLYSSTWQDVSMSADTGATWQSTNFNIFAYDLLNFNDTLLVTTFSNKLAQTPVNSINWSFVNTLNINSSFEFAINSSFVFVCNYDSVFYFNDKNRPASRLSLQGLKLQPSDNLSTIEIFGNLLLAGTQNQSDLSGKGIWYIDIGSITGVTNNLIDNNVFVYPNPFTTNALIKLDKELYNATLTIFNSLGQIVYVLTDIKSNQIEIHNNNFKSGPYYFTIENVNQKICGKFIIE